MFLFSFVSRYVFYFFFVFSLLICSLPLSLSLLLDPHNGNVSTLDVALEVS